MSGKTLELIELKREEYCKMRDGLIEGLLPTIGESCPTYEDIDILDYFEDIKCKLRTEATKVRQEMFETLIRKDDINYEVMFKKVNEQTVFILPTFLKARLSDYALSKLPPFVRFSENVLSVIVTNDQSALNWGVGCET